MLRNTAFILALLAVLSCSKERIDPFCNPGNYFPLEIGNSWVYDCYKKFDEGAMEFRERDSLALMADTLMLGYHYYRVQGTFYARPLNVWLTAIDGQIISSDNNLYFSCPHLTTNDALYPVGHFDFPCKIESSRKDTIIQVPAGSFNPVIHFEAHSMLDDANCLVKYSFHYAKGVGLIQWSARPVGQEFEIVSELVSFHTK